jgi:hypothetical protein
MVKERFADMKKTEELIIMEFFRDQYGDFPAGILNQAESPDFILGMGPKKKIGIELTRLSQQAPGTDPFSYENITACLSLKELKLPIYRKRRLNEYWLVITVQDPAFKPRFNLNNKLTAWNFNSGFSKAFLFMVPEGRIHELNIKA